MYNIIIFNRSVIMKNVEVQRTGDKLVLTIDLSKNYGKSPSGRSTVIAATPGTAQIPLSDGMAVKLGLTAFMDV